MTEVLNVHLFLSPVTHASRIQKESASLLSLGLVERITIIGMWQAGLQVTETMIPGVQIVRIKTTSRRLKARGWISRAAWISNCLALLTFVEYSITALFNAVREKPRYITCHNLLLLPVSWSVSLITGAKIIYAPHELEVEKTGLVGIRKKISKLVERAFIGKCYKTVVVCDPIARWYEKTYDLETVFVVRNIPEDVTEQDGDSSFSGLKKVLSIPEDDILFIYQGVLDPVRGVDALLRVFSKFSSSKHVVFMGYGTLTDKVLKWSKEFSNIHYVPAVPASEIVQRTRTADIGLNVIPTSVSLSYAYSLPNKFFEYMAAGIPIVVSSNLEYLSQLVRTFELGWVVEPGSIEEGLSDITHASIEQGRECVKNYSSEIAWSKEQQTFKEIYDLGRSLGLAP